MGGSEGGEGEGVREVGVRDGEGEGVREGREREVGGGSEGGRGRWE